LLPGGGEWRGKVPVLVIWVRNTREEPSIIPPNGEKEGISGTKKDCIFFPLEKGEPKEGESQAAISSNGEGGVTCPDKKRGLFPDLMDEVESNKQQRGGKKHDEASGRDQWEKKK